MKGQSKGMSVFVMKGRLIHTNSNDNIVIEFLTQESERGMSSFAINGMITALKRINNQPSTEFIGTFKKGPFNLHPPVTKYHKT